MGCKSEADHGCGVMERQHPVSGKQLLGLMFIILVREKKAAFFFFLLLVQSA